ncbi:efflux RND transporter periplasmic adaptor subunit [Thaumasiovibrio subtropicus]|uniref:efflux RND transporter periplasmic adaptor subunit n=1 Tax=Thaumasiovibrio subtropicus TaxID=1891207 RepID=UPI001C859ED2|nr:efflux RND transporter periplasmic adaptor subunit [Thaumasiovibrio subtropicus]
MRPALTEIAAPIEIQAMALHGVVQAKSRAELSFPSSGRLVEVLVDEGDTVKQGEVLARIDPDEAKNRLASATVELRTVRAEYQRAKSIYDTSQAISKSQLEEVETRFRLANYRLDEARRLVEDTELLAPFDGMISERNRDNHVLVQANETVLSLHDLSVMEVVVDVPEHLMVSGDRPEKVVAEVPALGNAQFELAVKNYSTRPDPVTQTYSVTFGFVDLGTSTLFPGMAVKVFSQSSNRFSDSVAVPLSAVLPNNQGEQYVWVVTEHNVLEQRLVKTGALRGDRIEVLDRLSPGEHVVVSGTNGLIHNMSVRPVLAESNQ